MNSLKFHHLKKKNFFFTHRHHPLFLLSYTGDSRSHLLSLWNSRSHRKGKLRTSHTCPRSQNKSVRGNQNNSQQEALPSSSACRSPYSRRAEEEGRRWISQHYSHARLCLLQKSFVHNIWADEVSARRTTSSHAADWSHVSKSTCSVQITNSRWPQS